ARSYATTHTLSRPVPSPEPIAQHAAWAVLLIKLVLAQGLLRGSRFRVRLQLALWNVQSDAARREPVEPGKRDIEVVLEDESSPHGDSRWHSRLALYGDMPNLADLLTQLIKDIGSSSYDRQLPVIRDGLLVARISHRLVRHEAE